MLLSWHTVGFLCFRFPSGFPSPNFWLSYLRLLSKSASTGSKTGKEITHHAISFHFLVSPTVCGRPILLSSGPWVFPDNINSTRNFSILLLSVLHQIVYYNAFFCTFLFMNSNIFRKWLHINLYSLNYFLTLTLFYWVSLLLVAV